MSRTQYIFIDSENVPEYDFARVAGTPTRVVLLLGAQCKSLPVTLLLFKEAHPDQLRVVKTDVVGRNALDFVLTYEVGKVAASDPDGYIHIISKDSDFESVIQHLKAEKRLAARWKSLSEIPMLRPEKDRFDILRSILLSSGNRPGTRKALENVVRTAMALPLGSEHVGRIIDQLVHEGVITFTSNYKILYLQAA